MKAPSRAVAVALAAGILAGLVVGPSPRDVVGTAEASATPPVAVLVRGHGNGHGRGLSQWGSYGWATVYSKPWEEILAFYYGGTGNFLDVLAPGEGAAPLGVRLQALDGAQAAVSSLSGSLSVGGVAGTFHALVARETSAGSGRFRLWGRKSVTTECPSASGAPSGYALVADNVAGPLLFSTPNGSSPGAAVPGDLIGVCEPATTTFPGGRMRYYRGTIRANRIANVGLRVMNDVPIELYLRGVVPRESPASWGDAAGGRGINALRAQAVAARSYALASVHSTYAKACDSDSCQVYGGAALRYGPASVVTIEDARTTRAVDETAGRVMRTPARAILRAEFTSANGGRTSGSPVPARIDDGEIAADPPLRDWSRLLSAADIAAKYPAIGVLTSITTNHDGAGGDFGGYAMSVVITGTKGSVTRTAWQFRTDWALSAPWFDTIAQSGPDPALGEVGPMLYVGDSVSASISREFAALIAPVYPEVNFQACSGRGMVGAACPRNDVASAMNLDGVGVVNASPPASVAVIALGYNDDPSGFDGELQQMVASLTAKGVARMVFVNLSTRSTTRAYAVANVALQRLAASNPTVSILDWNGYSADASKSRWFDNASLCCWVHLSATGRAEFAVFLRTRIDALRASGVLPAKSPPAETIPGLPISVSHRGSMVRAVQRRINATLSLTGRNAIAVDGQFGQATKRRLREAQTRLGLPPTGTVDRATWLALGLGNQPDAAKLTPGTRHPSVRTVHSSLAKVLGRPVPASDFYSASTAALVRTFQKRSKIPVTGNVDAVTWTMLTSAAAR